jgi:hypothetical protein
LGSETVSTVNYLEWLPKTTLRSHRSWKSKDYQPTKSLNLQTRKKPVWMLEEMLLRLIPFLWCDVAFEADCVRITSKTHNWSCELF